MLGHTGSYYVILLEFFTLMLTVFQGINIEIKMPAIGIIANFSSIKKLRVEQFRIVVTEFGEHSHNLSNAPPSVRRISSPSAT